MSDELDVLVIGGGACGLCAAIQAHDKGLSVAVIEKNDRLGGNSALSTGSVPAANSRFQREAGIEDSSERYFNDLMRIAGETEAEQLVRRMTAVSADTVEWLVDEVGCRMELITAYKHIGHSVSRLHAPKSRRGQDFVDDLIAAVSRRDIPVAVGNVAQSLIVEGGRVCGAMVDSGDGEPLEVRARAVILASNGFGNNRALVKRYIPEIAGAAYFGALGSDGEAIIWGEKLGAQLLNMQAYQGYAAVADPHGSILSWTTIEKGGVLLNEKGERFGDETLGYSGYAKNVLAEGARSWAIFDQRIFEIAMDEEEFAELWDHGGLKKADTVADVAVAQGLDPAAVEAAVAAYNEAAGRNEPDAFGRTTFGLAPLRGPFYSCRTLPALFHTQGGLAVDDDARVLRQDGSPVLGLYAGGGAAAGVSGKAGALGYASGNGLLTATALGRLAALAAAKDLRG